MSTPTVASALYIPPHTVHFHDLEKYLRPCLYTSRGVEGLSQFRRYIRETVESKLETVEGENIMEAISHHASADAEGSKRDWYCTQSYSTPTHLYELVYGRAPSGEDQALSTLACLCSLKQEVIYGPAYLVKSQYVGGEENRGLRISSASVEDLVEIICRRYYFTAVHDEGGETHTIPYQDHEYLSGVVFGTVEGSHPTLTRQVQIHGYTLVAFYYRHCDRPVNRRSSALLRATVRGPVLWLSLRGRTNEDVCVWESLTQSEYHRLADHSLGDAEYLSGQPAEGCWNRHLHLLSLRDTLPTCQSCRTPVETPHTCPSCHHTVYCSEDCLDSDRERHRETDDQCARGTAN